MGSAFGQYNPKLILAKKEITKNNNNDADALLRTLDSTALPVPDRALYNYLRAQILENTGKEHKALPYYLAAKKDYRAADSLDRSIDVNLDIVYLIDAQENNSTPYLHYITEYLKHNAVKNDPLKMARGYSYMAQYNIRMQHYRESLLYYFKALKLIKSIHNIQQECFLYNNIAAVYNENLNKPDSGLYYLRKNLDMIQVIGNNPYHLYNNYLNQASSYKHLKQYNTAIALLKKADSLPIKDNKLKHQEILYDVISQNYEGLGDFKNAYKYLWLKQKLTDSINVKEQNIAIGDIDVKVKYQALEKELENRTLKDNNKINKILVYTLVGLLIATFVIGLLIVINANRKEKISRQEKLIEQQKFDKALKDYELSSIDLMLQGQEKERQRIANDLHDNLGSMLATLKLNFENLKMRKNKVFDDDDDGRLFEKTDGLIDEAYHKVRRLAHAKNAGVFANDGLIPAIKKLAAKISIPGKLQVNVIPFGFTGRLDNTLEIAIFRIVQELATNIIKHSKAKEATIHLTQHDHNISIIIEDDGVGMDTQKISMADGMGLHAITKKAEQLDGTLTIDSTPGRGTTIILDLPI